MQDIESEISQWVQVVEQLYASSMAGREGVSSDLEPWLQETVAVARCEWGRLRATGFAEMEPLLQRVLKVSEEEEGMTLWCVRWHLPATAFMLLFCSQSGSRLGAWMDGLIQEQELVAMGGFCRRLASGRLRLASARTRQEFLEALRWAAIPGGRVRVLCDWRLDAEEWTAARALAGEEMLCLDDLQVGVGMESRPSS